MPIRINGQEYDSTTHVNQVEKPGFVFNTEYQRVNPAIYEPQRTNHFEFQVTGLSNLPKYVGYDYLNDSNGASVSNAEEDIRIAVDKAFIPTFQQSVLSVQRGNSTIKYAGKPSFNSGQTIRSSCSKLWTCSQHSESFRHVPEMTDKDAANCLPKISTRSLPVHCTTVLSVARDRKGSPLPSHGM